jgi:UDP-N-acetylmuramyl pentapeptide phosphotransferase/UDP-N-acetylglucosamine-1-phosphate transferase
MINFLVIFLLSFIINELIRKSNFLPNFSGDLHQKFSSEKSVPLAGGIIFLFFFALFFFDNLKIIFFSFFFIFLLGLLSDKKKIKSPSIRFFFQLIICLFLVIFGDLEILSTRIDFFDRIISYQFINIIFVSICILIIINGSNFIDGLNTLTLGYYLIITFVLNYLDLELFFEKFNLIYILLSLIFLNFFNRLFLGDNGTYLIGLVFSYLLIKLHMSYELISPYFVVLLLWYPAFEILFSIIRKILQNKSPMFPDNLHLHQLIFEKINKAVNKKIFSNIITAFILNFYNLIVLIIGSNFIYFTKSLIFIILSNVFIYLLTYYFFYKKIH